MRKFRIGASLALSLLAVIPGREEAAVTTAADHDRQSMHPIAAEPFDPLGSAALADYAGVWICPRFACDRRIPDESGSSGDSGGDLDGVAYPDPNGPDASGRLSSEIAGTPSFTADGRDPDQFWGLTDGDDRYGFSDLSRIDIGPLADLNVPRPIDGNRGNPPAPQIKLPPQAPPAKTGAPDGKPALDSDNPASDSPSSGSSAIPEPSALAMVGLGFGIVSRARRRR